MKVSELIKELKKYPDDEVVSIRIKEDLTDTSIIATDWGADFSIFHSAESDLYKSVIFEVRT